MTDQKALEAAWMAVTPLIAEHLGKPVGQASIVVSAWATLIAEPAITAYLAALPKPDGEENWANVYDEAGALVGNLRTHHAQRIVARFASPPSRSSIRAEAFEADILQSIVTRLVWLTGGTCSCGTMTPELKHHAERCNYRVAAEALELARALANPKEKA